MDRSDVVTLVAFKYTKDEIDQYVKAEELTDVFCNIQSISQTEFFEAGRNGISASYKVTLFKYDYCGQDVAILNGKRYAVYRTYEARNDQLELYLQVEAGA